MDKKIVVTGAAGFIGSAMVSKLNELGYGNLIVVDDFTDLEKNKNLEEKKYLAKISIFDFPKWLADNGEQVSFIFHIGGNSSTVEDRQEVFDKYNTDYSKNLWQESVRSRIPIIFTSSAATYGNGRLGYVDDHDLVPKLAPLNLYGWSKHNFDCWALKQEETPPFWVCLKPFNVFGPNEYHKGRMASMVWHSYQQIKKDGKVKLFRSFTPDYGDGQHSRDFIYIKDLLEIYLFFFNNQTNFSGIYNAGSGHARSFLDLVGAVFKSLGLEPNIEFVDIPEDIREKYQCFTEADMSKLRRAGFKGELKQLEDNVADYVKNYLEVQKYY
ncbi:MAG TPA: ADP-glyceromanno-heptose 6-epimerase [Candidatus Paceibacterota bacterium]|nr:ADP-glyceromanno-heptose 6-epimerase [Candidatus Paceibacterota bacterium]